MFFLELAANSMYAFQTRYMNQMKHSDALRLVYDGATMLLEHDQVNIFLSFAFQRAIPFDVHIPQVDEVF